MRNRPFTRRLRTLAAVLTLIGVTLGASGCGTTLGDLPLPGSSVSGDTITVNAEFKEALNLAQGGLVRIDGVDSGKVQSVTTEDFAAKVEMTLRKDAEIRQGATARLRYQTPLGELFIDISNPDQGPLLEDGATIPRKQTETAPTVEDALSQASVLINGGNLGSLQTVTEELNTIFNGREANVKSLLRNANTFMSEANATTNDIDVALRSLNEVSKTLDARKETIHRALREIAPAARVLRENTPGFTRLLNEVEKFARVANRTVGLTRRQLLTVIRQAGPVLAEFANLGNTYPVSLTSLVRLGKTVDNIVPADYISLSLVAEMGGLDLEGLSLDQLSALADSLGLDLATLQDILDGGGLPLPRAPRDDGQQGGNQGLLPDGLGLGGQSDSNNDDGGSGSALDLLGVL